MGSVCLILHLSLSQQGTDRTENRDVIGSIQSREAYLHVIADGTSRPGSGDLARALTHHLLKSFSRAEPSVTSCSDKALELVLSSLGEVHSNFCPDFPRASASYLALLVIDQTTVSIHAGDCCFGYLGKDQRLYWLSSPHCGPNWKGDLSHAVIADSPARKTLLNCMSYRRPHEPAVRSIQTVANTTWVLATDGFWAELSATDQLKAITEQTLAGCSTEDDVTFMLLRS